MTIEQYNILVDIWNKQAEEASRKTNKNTMSIVSVDEGEDGVTTGDD